MCAVPEFGSAVSDVTTAHAEAVASGMRLTFAVAAALILVALSVLKAGLATRDGIMGDTDTIADINH